MSEARAALPPALGLLLVAVLTTGRASAAAWPLGGGPPAVEVQVRERPAEEVWQVSYRLPEKAAGVEFLRRRAAFRHAAWGVLPEGSRWERDGAIERLCFPAPTRDLAISFRADYAPRVKDYQINLAFTDGSRLLYTGNLLLRPLASCGPPSAATSGEVAEPHHRFRFVTDRGRAVRVVDQEGTGDLTWRPAPGDAETYAFFGPAPAHQSALATLVLDPALPPWMARDLEALLPRLFERFAAETGMALQARPLVLLAFAPGGGSGTSFKGGVLDGVLAMTASGDGWATEGEEARRHWFLRLAHEAFHFWGGATLLADEESEWLSEAAAEIFALRAAWALGVLDAAGYQAAIVDAANACLVELGGGSLLSAPERGAYDSWYSCGTVLLYLADQAVERGTPGQSGISRLFRDMFAEGRQAGNRYGTGVFLGWLDKLSQDRGTVHALQRLIRSGVPRGTDAFLHGLLAATGLRVALAAPEELSGDVPAVRRLLRRTLVRCACGTASPEESADPDCARFAARHRIESVGGIEPRRDSAGAYARARTAALLDRPLEVATSGDPQAVTLFCSRDSLDPSFTRLLRLE